MLFSLAVFSFLRRYKDVVWSAKNIPIITELTRKALWYYATNDRTKPCDEQTAIYYLIVYQIWNLSTEKVKSGILQPVPTLLPPSEKEIT